MATNISSGASKYFLNRYIEERLSKLIDREQLAKCMEIAYKEGIREVVEFVARDNTKTSGVFFPHSKLKEWGIDEHHLFPPPP